MWLRAASRGLRLEAGLLEDAGGDADGTPRGVVDALGLRVRLDDGDELRLEPAEVGVAGVEVGELPLEAGDGLGLEELLQHIVVGDGHTEIDLGLGQIALDGGKLALATALRLTPLEGLEVQPRDARVVAAVFESLLVFDRHRLPAGCLLRGGLLRCRFLDLGLRGGHC